MDAFCQLRVSRDSNENECLDVPTRLSHIEHDLMASIGIMQEIVEIRREDIRQRSTDIEQRKKYDSFLDSLIKKAEDEEKFWREARMKLAVSGLWSAIVLICGACVYAAKEYLKR